MTSDITPCNCLSAHYTDYFLQRQQFLRFHCISLRATPITITHFLRAGQVNLGAPILVNQIDLMSAIFGMFFFDMYRCCGVVYQES